MTKNNLWSLCQSGGGANRPLVVVAVVLLMSQVRTAWLTRRTNRLTSPLPVKVGRVGRTVRIRAALLAAAIVSNKMVAWRAVRPEAGGIHDR